MADLLNIRPAADCRWDCASLGEVMLRFDPGDRRVRNARSFDVWEGGGEYNVARALSKTWGKRATVVTALPVNDLGWLVEDLICQGGVDMSHLLWREFDGIGRNTRVGLNFTERGFGLRPARSCSDRGSSAASQIRPGEVNWEKLFGEEGVRWFHTGGIFAALASYTAETVIEAVEIARKYGTVVSYDMNYRASLWQAQGGKAAAQAVNRAVAPAIDVLFGDGFAVDTLEDNGNPMNAESFRRGAQTAAADYPNIKIVATTLRHARSATRNDWGAIVLADGDFHASTIRQDLEIYDRIGGGDGFASGLIHALLEGRTPQVAVDYGAAHGALAMTTPGDTSMVRADEVEAVINGQVARVIR